MNQLTPLAVPPALPALVAAAGERACFADGLRSSDGGVMSG
jgi:hypothetical protein